MYYFVKKPQMNTDKRRFIVSEFMQIPYSLIIRINRWHLAQFFNNYVLVINNSLLLSSFSKLKVIEFSFPSSTVEFF